MQKFWKNICVVLHVAFSTRNFFTFFFPTSFLCYKIRPVLEERRKWKGLFFDILGQIHAFNFSDVLGKSKWKKSGRSRWPKISKKDHIFFQKTKRLSQAHRTLSLALSGLLRRTGSGLAPHETTCSAWVCGPMPHIPIPGVPSAVWSIQACQRQSYQAQVPVPVYTMCGIWDNVSCGGNLGPFSYRVYIGRHFNHGSKLYPCIFTVMNDDLQFYFILFFLF
jgi:hypothetical protein